MDVIFLARSSCSYGSNGITAKISSGKLKSVPPVVCCDIVADYYKNDIVGFLLVCLRKMLCTVEEEGEFGQ
jgi:hypothetical protein